MKINFNGTIEKDGKQWKVWTVKIKQKNSKLFRFFERHECESNYRWFFGKLELFGDGRTDLETRFARQTFNKKKDVTFQVIAKLIQHNLFGDEYYDCRMRYRRTEYTKLGGVWYSKQRKSPIPHLLDQMFHYADSNNLIGQVIRISDLNKERSFN